MQTSATDSEYIYRLIHARQVKDDLAVVDVDEVDFVCGDTGSPDTVCAPWGRTLDRLGGAVCSYSFTRNGQLQSVAFIDPPGNCHRLKFVVYRSLAASWRSGAPWQLADGAYEAGSASEEALECLLVPMQPTSTSASAGAGTGTGSGMSLSPYALTAAELDVTSESCVVRAQSTALAHCLPLWEVAGFVQKDMTNALRGVALLRSSHMWWSPHPASVLRTVAIALVYVLREGNAGAVVRACELLESPLLLSLAQRTTPSVCDDASLSRDVLDSVSGQPNKRHRSTEQVCACAAGTASLALSEDSEDVSELRKRAMQLSPVHQQFLVHSLVSVQFRDCSADEIFDADDALLVLCPAGAAEPVVSGSTVTVSLWRCRESCLRQTGHCQ
jgi:hypothetical protein